MDLVDTRSHIIGWYLRVGLAQHRRAEDKLAWLAEHWYLAVDAEFARQAQRAYERLNTPRVLSEWRPRSWEAARVTVVIAAAPHDLLTLVPAVVGRGWKPSRHPCALITLDDWNPAWWTQWAVPTVGGRFKAARDRAGRDVDNAVVDGREAAVADVRNALGAMSAGTRVVVVRDRNDLPLPEADVVVCACPCTQAPASRLHPIDRYRPHVFYARRAARPSALAFAPWDGPDADGRVQRTGATSGQLSPRDRALDKTRAETVPMRDCASLDCGCCLPFGLGWAEAHRLVVADDRQAWLD